MQAIQKFRADDGAEFRSEAECVAHEALCAEIDEVVSLLPPRPKDDGCNFANGDGYIQHDPMKFGRVREALLRIANRLYPHKWFDQALAKPNEVHSSYPARLIDETSRPLATAWYRVSCTDNKFREWGQPYYANNPSEAKEQHVVCAG